MPKASRRGLRQGWMSQAVYRIGSVNCLDEDLDYVTGIALDSAAIALRSSENIDCLVPDGEIAGSFSQKVVLTKGLPLSGDFIVSLSFDSQGACEAFRKDSDAVRQNNEDTIDRLSVPLSATHFSANRMVISHMCALNISVYFFIILMGGRGCDFKY